MVQRWLIVLGAVLIAAFIFLWFWTRTRNRAVLYPITYTGGARAFVRAPTAVTAGKHVLIETHPGISMRLYANGKEIPAKPSEKGQCFVFQMPPKPIRVQYSADERPVLIMDYFERTVGTPEEMPYEELILYAGDETHALLEHFENGGTPGETKTVYRVPVNELESVYTFLREKDVESWSDLSRAVSLCSKLYTCRFAGKDALCRISSEAMPENGDTLFLEIKTLLSSLIPKSEKAEEPAEEPPAEEPTEE